MGLYEFHGHIALGEGTIEEKFAKLAANNVVFFRDAGSRLINGDPDPSSEALVSEASTKISKMREIAAENAIQFTTGGIALHKIGLYGDFLGSSFENLKDFYKKVQFVKKIGADFVKVMYSGIASFKNLGQLTCNPLSGEEILEIVKICHGEGMQVMAHCNGADTIKYAIDAETDSIEHGIFMDTVALNMLASGCNTVWIPTIAAIANTDLQNYHIRTVKKGVQLGVQILPGSDCGCGTVEHGTGTVREYELLESCGLKINLQ